MIRVDNMSVGYGSRDVLQGIDLNIEAGEMVGLLGPNGSGKTTLLLALSGVLPIKSGAVAIGGRPMADLSPKKQAQMMASVPQRLETAFDLRVLSVVLMGRYPYISFLGGYQEEDQRIALEAMAETGTREFADRLMGQLSGGELQRVFIARALAQQTDILLLDEAASGLDIGRKVEIYDLLKRKNLQGATVLTAIHDLNLAALYCRRLVFLKKGKIVLDGPVDRIFTEDKLADIYETDIKISLHPVTGAPQAHLVPGDLSRSA